MIDDPGSEIERSYYASNSWIRVQTVLVIKFRVSCFMFHSCCSHSTSMYLANTKTYKLGLMQLEFVGLAYRFCTLYIFEKFYPKTYESNL
ncbi:hypothetical protein QYF36_016576 [Acer negundo]|nr:hypothetical protein QYF36_016576 [Acer negundo]